MKIKNIVFGLMLVSQFFWANAQEIRGSIVSNDNKVVVHSTQIRNRLYPYANTLQPIIGYIDTNVTGRMGLEKHTNIALSKGHNVKLTIDLELQQQIESILDAGQALYGADEILAAVMESNTGKVLAMASSNRYDTSHITEDDIPAIFQKFSAYPYEPGSVIKPLTLAIALEHGTVQPTTVFDTYPGRLEIGKGHFISDDDKFDSLSATDIIVHSSNVGISQIAWELTGKELRDGLLKFGLGIASEIELIENLPGAIKSVDMLDHKLHRANSSYGYGLLANFTQLLKAYSVFNNEGKAVSPHLIESIQEKRERSSLPIQ